MRLTGEVESQIAAWINVRSEIYPSASIHLFRCLVINLLAAMSYFLLHAHITALPHLCVCRSQDRILRCITDNSVAVSDILGMDADLKEEQMNHVLTLRGLLACNLLQTSLQKRQCVDFGVSR